MRVREWMNPDPVTVAPDTAVINAARLLACHGCRYLPVVDADRVVGIVSASDLQDSNGLPVSAVMSGPVVVARADEPVPEAARRMLDRGFEALPLVERGRFVGTLTLAGCLRALLAADHPPGAPATHPPGDLKVELTLEPA